MCGFLDVIQTLLQHGADIQARDWDDKSPLHTASSYGDLEVVKVLLSAAGEDNCHRSNTEVIASCIDLAKREQHFRELDGRNTGSNVWTRQRLDDTIVYLENMYK